MMKWVVMLLMLFTLMLAGASSSDIPDPNDAANSLVQLENRWLQAENDPNALESILADDFVHVLPMGLITKKQQIEFIKSHPLRNRDAKRFEDLRVRVYGNVGVVNGTVLAGNGNNVRKTFFTDVFAYRNGRWQAVNAQELPVGAIPQQ